MEEALLSMVIIIFGHVWIVFFICLIDNAAIVSLNTESIAFEIALAFTFAIVVVATTVVVVVGIAWPNHHLHRRRAL